MKKYKYELICYIVCFALILFVGALALYEKNRVDHIKKHWVQTTAEVIDFEGGELVISTVIYTINGQEFTANVQDGSHKIGDVITIYVNPEFYSKAESSMYRTHPFEFIFLIMGIGGVIAVSVKIVKDKQLRYNHYKRKRKAENAEIKENKS